MSAPWALLFPARRPGTLTEERAIVADVVCIRVDAVTQRELEDAEWCFQRAEHFYEAGLKLRSKIEKKVNSGAATEPGSRYYDPRAKRVMKRCVG